MWYLLKHLHFVVRGLQCGNVVKYVDNLHINEHTKVFEQEISSEVKVFYGILRGYSILLYDTKASLQGNRGGGGGVRELIKLIWNIF